ncbi:hypothetical protein DITRI_Ditri19aG0202300 [Diplodiscus trichospermus]
MDTLTLIEDERDTVEMVDLRSRDDMHDESSWLVAKLLTSRSYNRDAMVSTLRIVWKISKDPVVTFLDERAWFWIRIYGLPLALIMTEIVERISSKLGTVKAIDLKGNSYAWGRSFLIRVEIDIMKPLRRFVTVSRTGGRDDIKLRLGYERLPNFCYECGRLGHLDTDCLHDKEIVDDTCQQQQQYGPWLRASPLSQKFSNFSGGRYYVQDSYVGNYGSHKASVTRGTISGDGEKGASSSGKGKLSCPKLTFGNDKNIGETAKQLSVKVVFDYGMQSIGTVNI